MARRHSLALILLSSSLAVTLFSYAEGTAHFKDCQDGVVTARENNIKYLSCYNLHNPDSAIQWTLASDNGTNMTLGSCNATRTEKCASYVDDVQVYRQYGFGSTLYLKGISKSLSGMVTCHFISSDDTVDTASCRLNVARVTAATGVYNMARDSFGYKSFTFYLSTIRPSNVTWSWTKGTGVTVPLGTCYDNRTCSPLSNDFNLNRDTIYTYVGTNIVTKELTGRLSCSFTYQDQTETADMILNVFSQPVVENCTVAVIHHNWSAVLTCDVQHAFSSAGIYQFQVTESRTTWPDYYVGNSFYMYVAGSLGRSLEVKKHGWISFRDGLRSYVNATDYHTYHTGRLWYSWRLPCSEGHDTKVSVDVCASTTNVLCAKSDLFLPPTAGRSVPLDRPTAHRPRHNCTELTYIPETGDVTCVCTSRDLGTPAGRLVWLLGNVTVATGGYGVGQLSLPSNVMTREKDRALAVCRLDWIEPQEVALPLNMAWGPDTVDLHVYRQDVNGTPLTIVLCQATGLNPRTPDTMVQVRWTGPCRGQRGFTCTLDPRHAKGQQGQAVTCRVTNTANNGHSAEGSQLIDTDTPGPPNPADNCDKLKWAGIGAAVLLGIEVVLVLTVGLVVWARRRGFASPVYDSTKPKGGQQSNNTDKDAHFYEVINTKKNRDGSLPSDPSTDNGYENLALEGQEGHM